MLRTALDKISSNLFRLTWPSIFSLFRVPVYFDFAGMSNFQFRRTRGKNSWLESSRAQERVILAFLTRLLRFGFCHGTCSIHRWKLCSVALDDRIGLDNTGSHMLAFYKAFVPEERHHHLRHPVSSSMTSFWPSSRSTKNKSEPHIWKIRD